MAERQGVIATLVPNAHDSKIPGSFEFEAYEKGIFYICPCGCGELGFIGFCGRIIPEHPCWNWDGRKERPTLNPSIRRTGGCYYHGYLTNGVWSFQEDSGVKPGTRK